MAGSTAYSMKKYLRHEFSSKNKIWNLPIYKKSKISEMYDRNWAKESFKPFIRYIDLMSSDDSEDRSV